MRVPTIALLTGLFILASGAAMACSGMTTASKTGQTVASAASGSTPVVIPSTKSGG